MDSVCSTDSFWNTNLTWGNDRKYPEFTTCFQDTLLLWIPSIFLWVVTPIYVYVLMQFKDDPIQWSWKSVSKISVAVVQLSVRYLQLSASQQAQGTWSPRCLGLMLEGVSLLVSMWYINMERRKGFVTSGIQSLYWFFSTLSTLTLLYSDVVSKDYQPSSESTQLLKAYLALALSQFILTWFADVFPETEKTRECPLKRSSFINRLTFSWFTKFMSLGPVRPVEFDDISRLMPSDQADECIPKFIHTWNTEEKRLKAKQKDPDAKVKVSLLKVTLWNDWPVLLAANLLQLSGNLFTNFKPIMLGCLVTFMETSDQPLWKGYTFMAGFIVCLTFEFLIDNYVAQLACSTAFRLRNTLNSALFRKSMSMTNKARSENTVGEIVNLLTDVGQVQHYIAFFHWNWETGLNLFTSIIVLYTTVDYAVLAGVAVLAIVFPLNSYFAKRGHKSHLERMDARDDRVKLMTEILNGMKILKLYAWELVFGEKISDIRKKEMGILQRQMRMGLIASLAWAVAPHLMSVATFATYVYYNDNHMLTAGTAFRCMATFGLLTHTFNCVPHVISHIARSLVSLKRIEKYMNCEDIAETNVTHNPSENAISIDDGTFTWDAKLGPCLKDINLQVKKGSLVAILGTVGCGKSSLVSAMLGEMEKDKGKVNVHGSTAYVPQQAWIQNETLRNNILFGNKYREAVYNDVIEASALVKDLEILPGKDQTEIGEKGINLSGGQKQRVSIARSVYYNADIYLFDDPLSAVDSHVGKHIFENVIGEKGLLRNKTRVLVTHGITWLPYVDNIFVMDGGRISESGTYKQLLSNGKAFAEFIKKYKNSGDVSDDEEDTYDQVPPTLPPSEPLESEQLLDLTLVSDISEKPNDARALQRLMSDSGYSSPADEKDGSATVDAAGEKRSRMLRRSISRAISHEDKVESSDSDEEVLQSSGGKKLVRQNTLDDKFKMNEKRIKADSAKCDKAGKLVEDEEIESGKVQMKYLLPYFKALGLYPCVAIMFFLIAYRLCEVGVDLCIKDWTGDVDLQNLTTMPADSIARHDRNMFYIKKYIVVSLIFAAAKLTSQALIGYCVVRAATCLHQNMLTNILRGPMSFFDTTPVGRIVGRFSADIEPLDGQISGQTEQILNCTCGLLSVFIVIAVSMPTYSFMIIPIAYGYYEIQKRFVPVRRQMSRLESKRRTPITSHFSECLYGTSTIRAFNMQRDFAKENQDKVERLVEVVYSLQASDRWMNLRLDFMNLFSFVAAAILALQGREHLGAAIVGMAINYALQLNGSLNGFVRVGGQMEKNVICIERVGQYSSKKQEAVLHTEVVPAKSWPESGQVNISDYSLRYRDGLPLVLNNINVAVKPGEKIGIVGRTGAGKSSLTLGLFRLIEPATGQIDIDEHDISKLGLFDLRSNLTILPQEPVLFSGTLRTNLDPLKVHTDEVVFRALEHAHLKEFVDTLPDKLEYDCGEGGKNLSVGQRQLVCLARSLLKKSHVLVLDEATAAVDMKTDELIQNTIKREFEECTVLTIAHRINTIIDYDRILVLEQGRVREFDSPKVLLEDKTSEFYSMAKDSGLVN